MRARTGLWEPRGGNAPGPPGPLSRSACSHTASGGIAVRTKESQPGLCRQVDGAPGTQGPPSSNGYEGRGRRCHRKVTRRSGLRWRPVSRSWSLGASSPHPGAKDGIPSAESTLASRPRTGSNGFTTRRRSGRTLKGSGSNPARFLTRLPPRRLFISWRRTGA